MLLQPLRDGDLAGGQPARRRREQEHAKAVVRRHACGEWDRDGSDRFAPAQFPCPVPGARTRRPPLSPERTA